ncbi:cytochrome P450 87A3-like isoform X1 [Punica granatum]|uniref:Cytochrome P450 87A3-like isoform X1 n=2 Tax=Punica granatum TaxID=22663 RepID=A0A6P8DR16_PUNGR|nr:cytochrome P450 87A3-like isoform X1 [Punica granatum]
MGPLGVLMYVMALLVMGLIHYRVNRWRNPKCNGRLPPGSMGLPLIGETIQFLIPSKSIDIPPFIKTRTMKYGPIFKTSLAGLPVVVSSDPEFNYYILQQEGKLVEFWYLDSFAKLIDVRGLGRDGESTPLTSIGHIHKYMRNMVLSQIGAEALRERILPDMEETCQKALVDWSTKESLDVKKATSSVIFDFTAKLLFGFEPEKNMSERFSYIFQGLLSFPLNIPGTVFHKCLKNQKMGLKLMKDLMDERRAMPEKHRGDFLDQILDGMKTESFMSDDFAVFAMFAILLASFEILSSSLTLALVFLTEQPMVVKELQKEHQEILQNRERREGGVTWKEYKSMNFTMQVVNESLRMLNVGPGIMRRAIKDIHVNGYTIPEGWTIVIAQSALQLNPETYDDPLSFNPWRWKNLEPTVVAKSFIPFGGGARMCAGADFTKAFIAVFLHHLISKYSWEKVKGGEIIRSPVIGFGDGFYIKIRSK